MRLDATLKSFVTQFSDVANRTANDPLATDPEVVVMREFADHFQAKPRTTLTQAEVRWVLPGYRQAISCLPNPLRALAERTALRAQARVGLKVSANPEAVKELTFSQTKVVFRERGLILSYVDAMREKNGRAAVDWQKPPLTIMIVGRNRYGDDHTVFHPDCLTPEEAATVTDKSYLYHVTLAWNPHKHEYYIQQIDGTHSFPLGLSYVLGMRGWRIQNEIEAAILARTWNTRKFTGMGPITRPKLKAYLASGGVCIEYLWDLKRVANPLLERRPPKLYLIGTFKKPRNKNTPIAGLELVTSAELEIRRKKIGFVVPFVLENDTYRLDSLHPMPLYHGDELAASVASGEAELAKYYDLPRVSFSQVKYALAHRHLVDPFFRVVRHRRASPMPQFNFETPPPLTH